MNTERSSNFSEELMPRLSAVLEFALSSKSSDFYRRKYGNAAPAGLRRAEDLFNLPFLEKPELQAVPWRERLFVDENTVGAFGLSSGTTGRPVLIPRLAHANSPRHLLATGEATFSALGVKRVMILRPPLSGRQRTLANSARADGVLSVPGDTGNFPLSASLAYEMGVTGFDTTFTGLERLIEAYDSLNLDLGAIKWLHLSGEYVSPAKYRYLRSRLPNARFLCVFASAEFGSTRFFRCPELDNDPNLFHPLPGSHLFELVSPEGGPVPPGEPGELVHTDLELPKAFPFIRYRTGDGAALTTAPCACGSGYTLRMTGRLGFDSFKYGGVVILAEMVERALERVSDIAGRDFRLHLKETGSGGKLRLGMELQLAPGKYPAAGPAKEELEGRLAELVSDNFYLSGTRTLSALVKKGDFLPLKVVLTSGFPPETLKPRRIIPHF